MPLASGHTVETLQEEELQRHVEIFKGHTTGLVRLIPGRWCLPESYVKFADALYNFKFRETDVMVITYPKCGTTWIQEIIWTMKNNPNLDNPKAATLSKLRVPFLEMDALKISRNSSLRDHEPRMFATFKTMCPGRDPDDGIQLQMAEVVYVARNPKDVVVSYHHFMRLLKCHDFVGSFDQFVQQFVDDDLYYGPFWLHLKEAWEKRDHPNLHFIFFEELKANNIVELRRLNKFLETNLTEDQLQKVARHTSFSVMKTREEKIQPPEENAAFKKDIAMTDGGSYRKGEAGDWEHHLSREQQEKIDQWTARNVKAFGHSFPYSP
ncbi:sulfotransferase 1 family member D1-like isoform X2 [Panulirus ornatus]|uniref:sulfotransferase 1 family member D1-like isoform X2 n=1 Tax=Panulirus ornatus TaxID=150431 RepID=UPI003A8563D1